MYKGDLFVMYIHNRMNPIAPRDAQQYITTLKWHDVKLFAIYIALKMKAQLANDRSNTL